MCGGLQEAYNKAEPIMKIMGSHVRLMGGHGAGTAAKLVSKPKTMMTPTCKVYAPVAPCTGLTQLLCMVLCPPINIMSGTNSCLSLLL